MKQILAIALASVLAAGLTACDKKEVTKSETVTTTTVPHDAAPAAVSAASDPSALPKGSEVKTETTVEKK